MALTVNWRSEVEDALLAEGADGEVGIDAVDAGEIDEAVGHRR